MRPSQQREILETSGFNPKAEMLHAFAPDTPWNGNIEVFATHPSFCGEKLYPRQITLLKLIYLQTEIMTDYDIEVIEEWRNGFLNPSMAEGVQPDVWERIKYLKDRGYRRFPHIEAVIGRRGSKGKIGGILGAETIAYMYSLDNWQDHYGISPGKDGYLSVVATGKTQATKFQFSDIREAITNCQYLQPAISKNQAQAIHIRTPADLRRIAYLRENNIPADYEIATLRAVPMSSQSSTGRGATGFANFYDEFAHMLAGSSSRSGEEVYEAYQPSLDQFGKDSLTYIPSSPFTQTGRFYSLYKEGSVLMGSYDDDTGRVGYERKTSKELGLSDGDAEEAISELSANPEMLIVQLPSWGLYKDWQRSNQLVGHKIVRPIQSYDDRMKRLEKSNPEKFKVERKCLDPDTRVLGADLQWYRIADLKVGQKLVGMDENPPGEGFKQRRMRTATVEGIEYNRQPAYRLDFDDGSHVICSANHRWLSSGPSGSTFRWRSLFAQEGQPGPRQIIKEGDRIRYVADPWEKDDSRGAGYLAGIYDGEAHVSCRERSEFSLSFTQSVKWNEDVLDHTLSLLRERGFDPDYRPLRRSDWTTDDSGVTQDSRGRTVNETATYLIRGFDEVSRFVGSIGGVKMERQAIPHLWEGRGLPRPYKRGSISKQIVSITPLPEQELVDIQTSTRTFIAEGLVSHNSQFASVLDAWLDPQKIEEMFLPWRGEKLEFRERGSLAKRYYMHCDPALSGDNFALAIGHAEDGEPDEYGDVWPHVVIDYMKVWKPSDYDGNKIDYIQVLYEIGEIMKRFPSMVTATFDQWQNQAFIPILRRDFPKVNVTVENFTQKANLDRMERFKTALNLGWVHSPRDNFFDDQGNSLLEMEMKFLQKEKNKVDHPGFGPVTTKDLFDCVNVVTDHLLKDALDVYNTKMLGVAPSIGSTNINEIRSGRAGMGINGFSRNLAQTRSAREMLESTRESALNKRRGRGMQSVPRHRRRG